LRWGGKEHQTEPTDDCIEARGGLIGPEQLF
jgi:hypothetical protein